MSLFFLLTLVQVGKGDWNTETYQRAYQIGYEFGKDKGTQRENLNAWCSEYYSKGVEGSVSEEMFMKGCTDGYQDFKSGKPFPNFQQQAPSQANLNEAQAEARKYCETNYFARNNLDTECCINKVVEQRIKEGPIVDIGKVVFVTNFNDCGSLEKIYDYNYKKAYDIQTPIPENDYKLKEKVENISECTGKAMADKYKQNHERLNNMNNIFSDVFGDCRKNSSYSLSSNNNIPDEPQTSYSSDDYNEAYKYCKTDYFLNKMYNNECCGSRFAQLRANTGSKVDNSILISKADGNTFKGCDARENVSKHGEERASVLIQPYLGGRYNKDNIHLTDQQGKQVAACSGNKLAELFSHDPNPNNKRFNKLIREAINICLKNYTMTE